MGARSNPECQGEFAARCVSIEHIAWRATPLNCALMSKIREQFQAPPDEPLHVEPTGDLKPYVIFTQLKANGPWIYAGWLEAADDAMALEFAKEHYGQDQECVNVMAIRREHVTSSDGLYSAREAASGRFQV